MQDPPPRTTLMGFLSHDGTTSSREGDTRDDARPVR